MLGRRVILDTGWQTVSAAQDLAEIKLGTAQAGYVISRRIMQSSEEAAAEAEEIQVEEKRATGSFTSGSGGGSLTVVKGQSGDAAHGLATVERNNNTQAVAGSGALDTIGGGTFNVLAGEWGGELIPENWMPFGPSEAYILSVSAPDDAITMRAVIEILITHG